MIEQRKVCIGLIGCGFYAQNHLNAWTDLRSQNAELVAVCDQDPVKAEAAGKRFGAAWFTDARTMLESTQIDLLDITTRMGSHRALAALAAERKIAATVQKPFAPNWDVSPLLNTPKRVALGSPPMKISDWQRRCDAYRRFLIQEQLATPIGHGYRFEQASMCIAGNLI